MQEVELTFGRAAQVWWAWFWRAILFGMLFGFALGFTVGLIAHFIGLNPQQTTPFILISGMIIGVLTSIWAQAKVLKKTFSTFRVALIQI